MNNITQIEAKEHFYVYAYCDPDVEYAHELFEFEPFYIGYGQGNRIFDHLHEAKNNFQGNRLKLAKIRKILLKDKQPVIFKIKENLSKEKAIQLEIELIANIGTIAIIDGVKNRGPLTNFHKGGHGGNIPKTDIGRKAISDKLKGRKITWKDKISASKTGQLLSEETKRRVSESTKLALQDPVKRKKISDTHKGKPKSTEHAQKLKLHLQSLITDESKERARIRMTGRTISTEERSKIAAGVSKYVSQTIWITDGSTSKRVFKTDPIPLGWRRGRIGGWRKTISESFLRSGCGSCLP